MANDTRSLSDALSRAAQATKTYVQDQVAASKSEIDTQISGISSQVTRLENSLVANTANGLGFNSDTGELYLTTNSTPIPGASVTLEIAPEVDLSNYYTQEEINEFLENVPDKQSVEDNRKNSLSELEWDEESRTLTAKNSAGEVLAELGIAGGGGGTGGGSSSAVGVINEKYIGTDKVLKFFTNVGSEALIEFTYTNSDPDLLGTVSYYVRDKLVDQETISVGYHSWDAGPYLTSGENRVKVAITDENDSRGSKTWVVTALNVSVSASLNENTIYKAGEEIKVAYIPTGSGVDKVTHFIVDGSEVASPSTKLSGSQQYQSLTINEHGAHVIEIYTTATADGAEFRSKTIKFTIIVDAGEDTPIIAIRDAVLAGRVFTTVTIPYMVYLPGSDTADITQKINSETTSMVVDRTVQLVSFKPATPGEYVVTLSCGSTSESVTYTATELGYDIGAATEGLIFDFEPTGRSNSSVDRDVWVSNGISLTVDSDFDWQNGGFQQDENGNAVFIIKSGHRATINHNLFGFGNTIKTYGANFKMIYKAVNSRSFTAQVMTCLSDGVGFTVEANKAQLSSAGSTILVPLCEGEYTEIEYNITGASNGYEMFILSQGIPSRFAVYPEGDRFNQYRDSSVPITIGSDDCDVWLYRARAYDTMLTDIDEINNFIADAPDSDEMIARYERNQIIDDDGNIDIDKLAAAFPQLRIIKITCPTKFTEDKDEKVKDCRIEQIMTGGRPEDNWTIATAMIKGQGTSSNAYGTAARNLDFEATSGFDYIDANGQEQHMDKYSMTPNSIAENYFNIKVNIASSENSNNALLAQLYHEYQPYLRQARKDNPKVRDTMEFHPCVIFVQNESANSLSAESYTPQGVMSYYALGDFGNSKKNKKTQGLDANARPNEVIIEIANNTDPLNRFKSNVFNDETWEDDDHPEAPLSFRYNATADCVEPAKAAWHALITWLMSTDRTTATNNTIPSVSIAGTTYSRDSAAYRLAKFKAEFTDHFAKDSILYHYCFTSHFLMPDNRAKNTFWHCEDVTAEGQIWDCVFDYDNDTALGINNEGDLALDFGYEDIDVVNGKDVFNAQDSVLWVNVRAAFMTDITNMYNSLTELWQANRVLQRFTEYNSVRPERLWMIDIRRKYIRPYEDLGDTLYVDMLNGTKDLQRKYFIRYQSVYTASWFNTPVAKNDMITLRGHRGSRPLRITVVPYCDLYVTALFGSVFLQKRCKRGEEAVLEMPVGTSLNDTEMYIYSASMLAEVKGIETAYTNQVNFSTATKLRSIQIGSLDSNYTNSLLTSTTQLDFSRLAILEELRIDHCPNLTAPINVSGCTNLKLISCIGTPVSTIVLSNGGNLETLNVETLQNLTIRNQGNLAVFSYNHLNTLSALRVENTPNIPIVDIVINHLSKLNAGLRLEGIDVDLGDDNTFLSVLMSDAAKGKLMDANGNISLDPDAYPVISGVVHCNAIGSVLKGQIQTAYPLLTIDAKLEVNQFTVKFVNYNDEVLDIQYITRGSMPVDPITRADNPIPIPTRASDQQAVYTFASWDRQLSTVLADQKYTATYTSEIKKYHVEWRRNRTDSLPLYETDVLYGSVATYVGDTPTDQSQESNGVYKLFDGWDKCTTYITDDIIVYAKFVESTVLTLNDGKQLKDMTPINLHALIKGGVLASGGGLNNNSEYEGTYYGMIKGGDEFMLPLGLDVDYDNVPSEELVSLENPLVLDGTRIIRTGHHLFEEDKNWTLAIDFAFTSTVAGQILAGCANDSAGVLLTYSSGGTIRYGGDYVATRVSEGAARQIVVLRHRKGDNNLYVYRSGTESNTQPESQTITRTSRIQNNSELVFGGYYNSIDGLLQGEDNAKGTIYWSKIWYADFGEDFSKDLAAWPHMYLTMQAVNKSKPGQTMATPSLFRLFQLSDSDQFANCVFLMKDLLMNHRMNASNTTTGSWKNSEMRSWLNSRVWQAIPANWKRIIKPVKVQTLEGGSISASTPLTTPPAIDNLWIPSYQEVNTAGRSGAYEKESEGTFGIFTNDASRKKALINTITPVYWWLRSPVSTTTFYIVHNFGGTTTNANASSSHGVCFGFCI